MTSKTPAPGRSLAERFPAVAATWDSAANGRGPETVAAQAAIVACWRCRAGHTWTEQVGQRVRLDQWKRGDVAACRFCTGSWVEMTFSCGHKAVVVGHRAIPERLCPDCWQTERHRREAEWEARKAEGRARAAEVKPQCQADARVQADALWAEREFDRLPTSLHRRLRADLVSTLTLSLIGERAFGNPPHAKLVALITELDRIAAGTLDVSGEPIELAGTRYWAPALSSATVAGAPPEPEVVAELVEAATEALRLDSVSAHHLRLELMVARAYDDPDTAAATTDLTDVLTYALKDYARARGWRSWRELHVPLEDARATGRLDLTIVRPNAPDIVIEIDSANVQRSVAKLELALDRGALTVWLRWRKGHAPLIPGVHIVDLTGLSAAA
jgi:Probable Zinc-ribbon domain